MSKIKSVFALEVLDSRGMPTVEAEARLEGGISASAIAPSGASTGKFEALELRDGDMRRYAGKGVLKAVANVNGKIAKAINGINIANQEAIDMAMCELDGSGNKSKLGANATTAVSFACLKAAAAVKGRAVYAHLGGRLLPVPFMNVINGGKHAGSGLAVQEFMLAPVGFGKFSDALRAGVEIYHLLKSAVVKKYGPLGGNVGDEGGFAPPIKTTSEALELLDGVIRESGYAGKVKLAMDCAASSFYDESARTYSIDGNDATAEQLAEIYAGLASAYPIISIEDPFYEGDFHHFTLLKHFIGRRAQIVGDDLCVTQLTRLQKAARENCISALLLKVNQVGTVSEALECANYCRKNGIGVMVSHRSGETEDTTIADLAVGIECGMIKTGAPCRSERTAKYNRLLRIEEELGAKAKFSGERSVVRI